MAVTATVEKVQGKLKLNNGISPSTGEVLTVTTSMPTLSTTVTDQQIIDLASLITPLITKSIYSVEKVVYSELTD